MIPEVNIISGKASLASVNETGGSGTTLGFLGDRALLRKFLGSKKHLDWFKVDLNASKTIQDYKDTKNYCEWKYTYTMLKLRVKHVTYKSKI